MFEAKLRPPHIQLLEQGVIDISGEVNLELALHARECLLHLTSRGSPDVKLLITSTGGDVEYGLDIYDAFRLYAGKKTGMVHGVAASMAAIILQACTERVAAANAYLLIHHISRRNVSLDELRSDKKIARIRGELEASQQRQYEILSQRTGRTIRSIRAACARNQRMSAQQALDFGLIDKIV